MTLITTYYRSC